jgi:hypothetical protein
MRLRGHAGWLALCTVVACSVYDDTLLTVGAAPGGAGGSSGSGGKGGGGSGGSAGSVTSGGKGGGAGSGGSSGTNVSGGSSGSTAAGNGGEGGSLVLEYELIDDMEDNDEFVAEIAGRSGRWVTDNDGSGTTVPVKSANFPMTELVGGDARAGSTYAVHLDAQGFQGGMWGAFVSVHFKYPDATPYDASAYCGFHFWAKRGIDDESFPLSIEVRVPDRYTIPVDGNCTDPAAGGAAGAVGFCYDHHKRTVSLSSEWAEYTIFFDQLKQGNWSGFEQSPLGEIDETSIASIEFFMVKPQALELWVDDVSFIKKPEGGDCP